MRKLLLVAALAWAAPLHAQVPDDVAASIRARVDQGTSVGMIVGVVDSGGARYFAYGNTALQNGHPVNEHTIYEIGSVTKVFTALALADMVVHHEVSLDDPVARYLPGSAVVPSTPGHQITLRLLSAQRSGLPRMPSNFAPANPDNPYADYSVGRLIAFLAGYTLPRDPGAQYEYSNVGQGLLGYALARHDNGTYEALVTRRVLQPLGMGETMVTLTADARSRLAMGHNGGQQVANWDLDALAGAGALRSTAADLTRFLAAAMGLTHTTLDSAFALTYQVQGDAGSPQMDIGLAWHILKLGSGRIIWHNGGTGGYRSWIGFDPERKLGIVVLTNSTVGADDIGLHLLTPAIPLTSQRPSIAISADSLEAYVGNYQLAPNFVLTVTRQGDMLLAQATGQGIIRIWPSAPNEFFYREVNAQLTFVRDSTGRVTSLVLHQNGRDIPAPRTP